MVTVEKRKAKYIIEGVVILTVYKKMLFQTQFMTLIRYKLVLVVKYKTITQQFKFICLFKLFPT